MSTLALVIAIIALVFGCLGRFGAASGDLTGTYPNPHLKAVGIGAGIVGSGTSWPVESIDNNGRVTAYVNQLLVAGDGIVITVVGHTTTLSCANTEKLIATVDTVLSQPVTYAGTPIRFQWYYTMSTTRLRVVVTMPEGYNNSATDPLPSSGYFQAQNTLPAWACNSLDGQPWSWLIEFTGIPEWNTATQDQAVNIGMSNNQETQGLFQIYPLFAVGFPAGAQIYLGASQGSFYNATTNSWDDNYIGEYAMVLTMQEDIAAWNAHY